MNYIEENLKTQIKDTYDVIVCGGGVAGVSAALTSSRQGKKTLLIEKSYILGGLGTSGLITIYLPICDGCGHQVSFGIAEELLKLSIKDTYEDSYPKPWLESGSIEEKSNHRYMVQYNPFLFAIACEQELLKNNVEILYGTSCVNTIVENDKIKYLILSSKTERYGVECISCIDATGDADIAYMSGEETIEFKSQNILAGWYYSYSKINNYKLNMVGFSDILPQINSNSIRFNGIDSKEISEVVCKSHNMTYNDILEKRKSDNSYIPVNMATIPQIRMSRGLKGNYLMNIDMDRVEFTDSVGLFANWRKSGPIYELPFSSLHGNKIKNLCSCGRAIGCEEVMWDLVRVIPVCAVSGEACGVAASMTDDFTNINIKELQNKLINNKVKLFFKDII